MRSIPRDRKAHSGLWNFARHSLRSAMYFMPALIVAAFGLALCSTSIHAQTYSATPIPQLNSVSDLTQTPIPGAGHDYQQLFGETINNSNGSVSLKISFPMAKGRGISLPFAWTYNSAEVNPLHAIDGVTPQWGYPEDTSPGWKLQDGIPGSTVQVWTRSTPPSEHYVPPAPCNYQSGMTFTGPEGVMHNLYLEAHAPAPGTSTNQGKMCDPGFATDTGNVDFQVLGTEEVESVETGDGQVVGILQGARSLAPDPPTDTLYTPSGLAAESPTSTPFTVIDKKGLRYSISGGSSGVDNVSDSNGNSIDFNAYKDTLDNSLPVASGTPPKSIQVNNLIYTADWKTVTVNYSVNTNLSRLSWMGCTNVNTNVSYDTPRNVLSSLTLPNGTSYKFYYGNDNPTDSSIRNDYGLLNEVIYPDGGWIKYTWQLSHESDGSPVFNELTSFGGTTSGNAITGTTTYTYYSFGCNWQYQTPVLATRQVSFDGSSVAQTQTYSFSTSWEYASAKDGGGVNDWSQKTTTVTTTDNNAGGLTSRTEYTYLPYVVKNQPDAGDVIPATIPVESSIAYYDWGGSSPTKTVTKTWLDQFNMTSQATTINTAAGSRVSYTTYGYGIPCSGMFNTLVYLSEQDDYDFGLLTSAPAPTAPGYAIKAPSVNPTKRTVYTYHCFQNGSYVPPKVASITIENGARAPQAETQYGYDESALTPVTAVQHTDTGQTIRGNLTSVTKCNPVPSSITATCSGPKTTYTYDTTGQVASMTDPCGNGSCGDMSGSSHTTTFSFADSPAGGNSAGNTNAYLTKITYPGGTLQKSFQYDYKNAVGYLISSFDENNQRTTYTYADALYRPTEVDYPDGGITKYVYNDTELSPTVTTSKLLDAANGQWETSVTTMDGMGHVVETDLTTDPDGPDIVTTSYDGEGHPRVVSNPYRSSPDGYTTYYYDSFGRQIKTVKQDGNIQQWCYNGVASTPAVHCRSSQLGSTNPGIWVDFTDENVNHWERVYNVFGDLTKVMEPNGTASSMETDYSYDVLNNLKIVTQLGEASGYSGTRTRNFSYDALSRLGTANNPETGTISYTYDANSNVSSKTDARGVTTSYLYDTLNRLLSKSYSDGVTPLSCYQYDSSYATGPESNANWIGRLTNSWTQSVSATGACSPPAPFLTKRWILAYDAMGRILTERQYTLASQTSGTLYTPSYTYDQAGNLKTSTSGVGPTSTSTPITLGYAINGAGRLQTVISSLSSNTISGTVYTYPTSLFSQPSTSQSSICANATSPTPQYSPFGGLMNAAYGSGLTLNRAYDSRLRVICESDAGTPQSIVAASQTINFTAPTSPVTYGTAPITLSATASSGLPVTFSVLSGPATVSGDTLTITGTGTVVVAADQAGDANYTAAAEVTQSIVVNPAYDSAIQLQFTSTQLVYPGATNMVVCISPAASATATGSVSIYDGTTLLTTQGLGGDGCAYWYISPGLSAGSHAITAAYSGDSNNPSGTSAATTLSVSTVPVNMSVSCWNASFAYGGNYQCTVSLSSNAGAPQGSLTYSLDSGSATTAPLNGGNAQFTIAAPSAGSHQVVVGYAEQTNYAAATPQTESFTVTSAPVNVSLTPSTWYAGAGTSISFTAAITSWSAGAPNASGTVSFFDSSNLLSTVPVNASGQAAFATASLTTGSHTITATYSGDANYASGSGNVTITLAAGN